MFAEGYASAFFGKDLDTYSINLQTGKQASSYHRNLIQPHLPESNHLNCNFDTRVRSIQQSKAMNIQIIRFLIQLASLITVVDSFQGYMKSRSPKDVTAHILTGLRDNNKPLPGTTSTVTQDHTIKSLNLETDFYDPSTGLHSEGVWHNALVGIASLQLQNDQNDEYEYASRIADSLYKHAWDGCSFRRRSWSGNWDHSSLLDQAENPPEQANYYRESDEHRCVQHGIALVFWSKLLLDGTKRSTSTGTGTPSSKDTLQCQEQQKLIAEQFLKEFWDESVQKWTTVSQTQGRGSTIRLSASAAKQTLGVSEETQLPYYRAVDQAIAVLACLEHLKVLQQQDRNNNDTVHVSEERLIGIIQTTCRQILCPTNGFGYENIREAKNYLGLDRNRNFWHDGWTFLALIKARQYLWPLDTNHGEVELDAMWNTLVDMYRFTSSGSAGCCDGTLWHWPREMKDELSNVRYCGDNSLAFAIRRNLALSGSSSDAGDGEEEFWRFIDSLRQGDARGLASVADAYPQVRLHPNTELAALLVWP